MVTVLVDVEIFRYEEQNGVAVLTAVTDLTTSLIALQTSGLMPLLVKPHVGTASKVMLTARRNRILAGPSGVEDSGDGTFGRILYASCLLSQSIGDYTRPC